MKDLHLKAKTEEVAYHFSVFLMYMIAVMTRLNQLFEPIMIGEKVVSGSLLILDIACIVFAFTDKKILEQKMLAIVILIAIINLVLFVFIHILSPMDSAIVSAGIAGRLCLPAAFTYRLFSLNWIGRDEE